MPLQSLQCQIQGKHSENQLRNEFPIIKQQSTPNESV